MDIEQLVRDTFTAHEDLAPDERAVRAAVDARLVHSRSPFPRPLAVAASAVVVAGAAVGAVALAHHGTSTTGHGTATHRHVPAASQHRRRTSAPRPATPTAKPLTMPFDLGWLPAGTPSWVARRINTGGAPGSTHPSYDGEYLFDLVTAKHRYLVDVAQMPGGINGAMFKSGAGRSVRIDGRPGIESAHAGGLPGYEVYYRDSAGGTMYVNVAQENAQDANVDGDATQLTAWGRRIAAGVTFPGTTTVQPTFGVGYVPQGLKIVAFDVDLGATSYNLGNGHSAESAVSVGTDIAGVHGSPGRDVQGHPTKVEDQRGYRTLYVLHAVRGATVGISSGSESLHTLYRIADGLVLPN